MAKRFSWFIIGYFVGMFLVFWEWKYTPKSLAKMLDAIVGR